MEHAMRDEGEVIVLSFSGDVDLEHSPRARALLLAAITRGRRLLVDLSGVSYIDSSGVASLVEAFQASRRHGQVFALVSVNAPALRVLELARLDSVFTIYATLAEGLDAPA